MKAYCNAYSCVYTETTMNVEKESIKKLIDNSGEFLERKYDV